MHKQTRLVYFVVFLLLLLASGYWAVGSFSFIINDFWFAAGLLLLLLGSLIEQPFFSTDSDILINGVGASTSLLAVEAGDRTTVWWLFLVWSLYLVVSSYALMWLRSQSLRSEHTAIQLLTRLNRRLGSPRALFSAFFIWGSILQLGLGSQGFSVLFVYWSLFVLLDVVGLGRTIEDFVRRDAKTPTALGRVSAVIEPNVIIAEIDPEADLDAFQIVSLGIPSKTNLASGYVIDERRLRNRRFAKLAVFEAIQQWQHSLGIASNSLHVYPCEAPEERQHCIGVVEEGSGIKGLRTIVHPNVELAEGQLLTVELGNGDPVFYQIVGAYVDDLSAGQGESYKVVNTRTQQLGKWSAANQIFTPFNWVAPPASPVYKYSPAGESALDEQVQEGRVQVGFVPGSDLPLYVNLDDLVTLNTAILGVTGSGKSYLAFYLVEKMVMEGVRTLVLDVSRQYERYLTKLEPQLINDPNEVSKWLKGDSGLGIYGFGNGQSPAAATALIARAVFDRYKDVDLPVGADNPAKLCIVFEEAHSLIPEWNQCSRDDQQNVNLTARYLLQFRKYGLGCILISQRTANVTKTILNQCNTIFAMQCFDQTGFDFLKNYMGEDHVTALSALPARSAVLVGKASSSARPVIIELPDLSTRWLEN